MKNQNTPGCRTLKFTDEEITLLKHALGIASDEYSKLFKRSVELSNVWGNDNFNTQQKEMNLPFHHLACKIAELNVDIGNGQYDVK